MPDSPANFWTKPILDAYSPGFIKAADGIRGAAEFGDPEQWRFDWDRPYTRDEWLDQLPTFGGWRQMPAAVQQDLLAGVGAAVVVVPESRITTWPSFTLDAAFSAIRIFS